jgi:hypothetical protein
VGTRSTCRPQGGGRLSRALGRDVQTVRLADARRVPTLLADVIAQGRVLVDREGIWADLGRDTRRVEREARKTTSLEDAIAALDLDTEVARSRR